MRPKNLAGLMIGRHLVFGGQDYRLQLSAAETKAGRPYHAAVQHEPTPYIDRWLQVHRSALQSIAGAHHEAGYTAQREGDIICMPWAAYDGEWIRLRQRKTGKLIDIPVLAQLRAALEAVPQRGMIMLTTETGRPYKEDWFRHRFSQVMEKAGLAGRQFRDLRCTAVVRMGEQDIHDRDIAAITGHEIERTRRILETYLRRNRVMAARAAKVMERYYAGLTSEVPR